MSHKTDAVAMLTAASMGIFSKLPAAGPDEVAAAERDMNKNIPESLKHFYTEVANGMVFGHFKIMPVFSKRNPKKTAESLVRINSLEHSTWFNEDVNTINRFIVFCVEGSGICYCFKADAGDTVWQWARGWQDVQQLDYDFWGWLKESLQQECQYLFR